MSAEDFLLQSFVKYGGAAQRGLITAEEYVSGCLERLASSPVYPQLVTPIWHAVPGEYRSSFSAAINAVVHPDYLYHAFHFGGHRPITNEERHQNAVENTTRLRAWADEFRQLPDWPW